MFPKILFMGMSMNTSNFYNDVTGEESGLAHVIYDYSDGKIYRIPEDRLCELEVANVN